MQIKVTRDQAVWEREEFFVDIPDDTPLDEIDGVARAAVDNFQGYHTGAYLMFILDEPVHGLDTVTEFEIKWPDDTPPSGP